MPNCVVRKAPGLPGSHVHVAVVDEGRGAVAVDPRSVVLGVESGPSLSTTARAVALLNVGLLLFVLHDALSKVLTARYPIFELIFLRSLPPTKPDPTSPCHQTSSP